MGFWWSVAKPAGIDILPAMTSKRPSRRSPRQPSRRRARSRAGFGRRLWGWLWRGALLGAVLLALALVWLDFQVRERFDSHAWQLPARVFARPVELYQGRDLERQHLLRVLGLMRYQEDGRALSPGTFAVLGDSLLIHTRGFADSDGGEGPRLMRVELGQHRIRDVIDVASGASRVARLEPLQIGSIHPGHTEDRVLVRLEEVPETLVGMLLATEDRAFYQHHGISLRGLARAMLVNLKAGELQQGGSTLTQQLVKNFWLTRERTLARKLVEIPMALLLELHYSKEQILEAYINEVYLGQDGARAIHGMGLAARYYFGRPLEDLELHQQAMLVALLKGPSYYDPRRHPVRARERRDTVLFASFEEQVLDGTRMARARDQELDVIPKGSAALYAFPAFVDLVRRQLARDYPEKVLASEGLMIHSTLDVLAQFSAEQALARFLKSRDKVNGAVVVTAPNDGDVLALVGDKAPRSAGFNRALDAVRPIGSLAKPVVVLAALQKGGFHLATPVQDGPITVRMEGGQEWTPQNFDGQSRGMIPLQEALVHSRNQAMAHLGMQVGLPDIMSTFRQLGVQRPIPPYPSMILGSLNMSPFEVAVMYQTLATGGFNTPLRAITDVLDKDGQPLARYPVSPQPVVNQQDAYILQWALRQVIERGTGTYAHQQLPGALVVAGKTGTSDGYRDAWFAGFSGSRLTVVWLGNDDNEGIGLTGSSGALRVWTEVMASMPQRPLDLAPPPGVSLVWMDRDGQRLSGEGCEGALRIALRDGMMPDKATACGRVEGTRKGIMKWLRGWFD